MVTEAKDTGLAAIRFEKKVWEAVEGHIKPILLTIDDPNGLVSLADLQNNKTEVRLSRTSIFGENTASDADFDTEEDSGTNKNPGFAISWEESNGQLFGKALIPVSTDGHMEDTELRLMYVYRHKNLGRKIARRNYTRRDKAVFVVLDSNDAEDVKMGVVSDISRATDEDLTTEEEGKIDISEEVIAKTEEVIAPVKAVQEIAEKITQLKKTVVVSEPETINQQIAVNKIDESVNKIAEALPTVEEISAVAASIPAAKDEIDKIETATERAKADSSADKPPLYVSEAGNNYFFEDLPDNLKPTIEIGLKANEAGNPDLYTMAMVAAKAYFEQVEIEAAKKTVSNNPAETDSVLNDAADAIAEAKDIPVPIAAKKVDKVVAKFYNGSKIWSLPSETEELGHIAGSKYYYNKIYWSALENKSSGSSSGWVINPDNSNMIFAYNVIDFENLKLALNEYFAIAGTPGRWHKVTERKFSSPIILTPATLSVAVNRVKKAKTGFNKGLLLEYLESHLNVLRKLRKPTLEVNLPIGIVDISFQASSNKFQNQNITSNAIPMIGGQALVAWFDPDDNHLYTVRDNNRAYSKLLGDPLSPNQYYKPVSREQIHKLYFKALIREYSLIFAS